MRLFLIEALTQDAHQHALCTTHVHTIYVQEITMLPCVVLLFYLLLFDYITAAVIGFLLVVCVTKYNCRVDNGVCILIDISLLYLVVYIND